MVIASYRAFWNKAGNTICSTTITCIALAMSQTKPHNSVQVLTGVSKNSLPVFFISAYALMWACFFAVAEAHIPARTILGNFLLFLGTFAPALAALCLTAQAEGREGVRSLLGGILKWQVGWQWYLFAAGFIAAIKLMAALIHRVTIGGWPRFGVEPWYLLVIATLFSTPIQAGEEIGWRGYALPRLAGRFGLRTASVLLGLIWGCWHLPQFFIPEADTYGQSFFLFVLQVTALSVAMAWLYARTNGSLLLTMLMHAAVNNTKDIVPSPIPGAHNTFTLHASPVGWLSLALLWVCAGFFLATMPKSIQQSAVAYGKPGLR